ncbi:MAG TPA: hypothetical protein VFI82_08605 [Terriglobales bacterium]|jgi:hypothetical protein|nr:hypothetical protein [Terriglobales bacterium]
MSRKFAIPAAICLTLSLAAAAIVAARSAQSVDEGASGPSLTIYNQNFAVVRQPLSLDLNPGVNDVRFTETTNFLEPDSVMLRDPLGRRQLQVLEQNFRNDPVSQELLLSMYEGKTISFRLSNDKIVPGRVVRSGYTPRVYDYRNGYNPQGGTQPIIETDGHLQFGLPGLPLFPALGNDSVLKPTLNWQLVTDKPGKFEAELSYVSGGMRWQADYNVVAPESGDVLDVTGWVTIDNTSGKTFDHARVRLMAGDINKILPGAVGGMVRSEAMAMKAVDAMQPAVTERSFDEYHLYTLQRPVTMRDHETKQVEFVRATGVHSQRLYVYDGANINWNQYRGWSFENIRNDPGYGTQSNPKVWVMQELKNSSANHLGIALPRGRMRFYRRDEDGRLQFTGENMIDHTPPDETIRLYTGNAFDLVGERRRVDYHVDNAKKTIDESFEIKIRNHKKEAAVVRAVEHLYRCNSWQITSRNHDYRKLDSHQVEFPVAIPANGEVTIMYAVHYTW